MAVFTVSLPGVIVRPVPNTVECVQRLRAIRQIGCHVVHRVAVKVSHLCTIWTWAYECLSNKGCNYL